ncbi:MAG: ribokinase [Chloroflexi bacterium]|nr:MAG: ribokinase [Chloroflexota bacterium]
MPPKIVVVGSFNQDLNVYVPQLPGRGETIQGDRFTVGTGGKGANQAIAAARLGAEVTFVGRVGDDEFGDLAFKLLAEDGINTDYIVRDPMLRTGVAMIFVEDSGENAIATAPGANLALTPADVEAAAAAVAKADILLTQFESPYNAVRQALLLAGEYHIPSILNPAPIRSDASPPDIPMLATYLTPNETELAALVRDPARAKFQDKVDAVLIRDEQTLIITQGEKGASWYRKDGVGHIESFVVKAVDTVGAGDSFNGGLAVALAEGKTLEEALRFANAAGALCVTRHGASASIPSRDEVEALLATN